MELRQTKKPRRLDDTAVKARLYDLVTMANRFLADFRSVETHSERNEMRSRIYIWSKSSHAATYLQAPSTQWNC